jgi:hypothetical protein
MMRNRPQVGDRLQVTPSYDRNVKVQTHVGPRCYICGRLFRRGERGVWVALNGAERTHFVRAGEEGEEGSVLVGKDCARLRAPRASIISAADSGKE